MELVFNSFIISNLKHFYMVLHNCTIASSMKIEKIQEGGIRMVHDVYTCNYNDLLQKFGKDLMYVSRLKKSATFVFKLINKIGPDLTYDLLNEKHLPYSLRDSSKSHSPSPHQLNTVSIEFHIKVPYGTNFPVILKYVPKLSSFIPC